MKTFDEWRVVCSNKDGSNRYESGPSTDEARTRLTAQSHFHAKCAHTWVERRTVSVSPWDREDS